MTHTAKHTPGPWVVGCERVGRQTTHYITIQKSSIYFNRGVGQTEDEMRANAHLIAAAPAMYEALKMLLKHEGERAVSGIGTEHDSEALETAKIIARTALAQAEGVDHE